MNERARLVNQITDMILNGCSEEELLPIICHSMEVIDAAKETNK